MVAFFFCIQIHYVLYFSCSETLSFSLFMFFVFNPHNSHKNTLQIRPIRIIISRIFGEHTKKNIHPNSSNLFSLKPVFMIPHRCSIINTDKKAPLTPNTHFPMQFETVYYPQKIKNNPLSTSTPLSSLSPLNLTPFFHHRPLCVNVNRSFLLAVFVCVCSPSSVLALVQFVLFAVPLLYRFLMYISVSLCVCVCT